MKAFLSPWRVSCFTEIARTFNELIKDERGGGVVCVDVLRDTLFVAIMKRMRDF